MALVFDPFSKAEFVLSRSEQARFFLGMLTALSKIGKHLRQSFEPLKAPVAEDLHRTKRAGLYPVSWQSMSVF